MRWMLLIASGWLLVTVIYNFIMDINTETGSVVNQLHNLRWMVGILLLDKFVGWFIEEDKENDRQKTTTTQKG